MSYMPFFANGCSAERLAAAELFFSEEAHSPTGTDAQLAKVGEGVTDCVSLRDREGEAVGGFLARYAAQ